MSTFQRSINVLLLFVLSALLILPLTTSASPIVRSGESVSVAADQVLEGDFYGFGSSVSISGMAEHDVYAAGGSVTINAPVTGDLVVAGGSVQVHAPVGDDARIVGGEVVIADRVTGDLVVAAGSLKILSTGSVEGDLLFAGGDIDVGGEVKGSITGFANTVRIDASVGGNVTVTAEQRLALGDRAEILGNLEYRSTFDLARSQGSVIVGDIHKRTYENEEDVSALSFLMPFAILLFAALTIYLLFRPHIEKLVAATERSYGMQGLIGLAACIGIPIVAFILIASVLGSLIGIALLFLYLMLLLVSWAVVGTVFGVFILKPLVKTSKVNFVSVVVGVFVYNLLFLVPYAGPLVMIALYLVVFGGILSRLYQSFRS